MHELTISFRWRVASRSTAFVLLLAFSGCVEGPSPRRVIDVDVPPPRPADHVVIVSIDGFASYYLRDQKAHLPELRRLAEEGVFAQRLRVSFPSVTWTVHTTLVTGSRPARHGVIANTYFDRKEGREVRFIGDAVFRKDEAIRVPTLYDVVHEAGGETASIIWPASNGAATLDWVIPDSNREEVHQRYTTPGLAEELEEQGLSIGRLGAWGWDKVYSAARDDLYARIAAYLLEAHRPSLVLVHLITPDGFQHAHGPQTPEAYWAVRYADERIGRIRQALEAPGLRGRSALIVVSDHGFLPYEREVRPNVALLRAGHIELDQNGTVDEREAWVVPAGGAAAVYVLEEDPQKKEALADRLADLFEVTAGIERVLGPEEFAELGLPSPSEDPRQGDLMLVAREGHAFSGSVEGNDIVVETESRRGAHGYPPDHPAMGGLFIAWGAGIRHGAELEVVRAIDVAPTAAWLLGFDMPGADGDLIEDAVVLNPLWLEPTGTEDESPAEEVTPEPGAE